MAGVYATTPSPHLLYSHAYHAAVAGPQDHELKKQYLALLPPQQIIDICLNFDLYVPPYAKTTVWPADIKAAIAALTKSSQSPADPPPAVATNGEPVGLTQDKSSTPQPASKEPPGGIQPPDKSPPTTGPTPAPPPTSPDLPQPNSQPTAQPPQQPPYPHQPYGYPQAQPAYPHTPYYPHPPGYPAYPGYPPYPGYPQAHPQSYPQPAQSTPAFPTAPQANPPPQQDLYGSTPHSGDDLPSYEDMIAEALLDSADPDGCAPKDLFTWMAGRYPLQSNFRPSASQALQKAYKRGRFFKTAGGKYRLNATWEGGATSRRTTRRPQTQTQAAVPAPTPGPPFTHAPLVHHHQPAAASTQAPTQPHQPTPYGYPYQPYPGYPSQPQPQATQPESEKSQVAAPASGTQAQIDGHVDDPYEAAQNILKAINFGSLLQLPPEEDANQSSPTDTHPLLSVPSTLDIQSTEYPGANPRAELQAHLALLAAQLAELAHADDEESVSAPLVASTEPQLQPVVATQNPSPAPMQSTPIMASLGPSAAEQEEEEDDDDNDMEEVI